jgi:L-rhamnose mutarotase
MFELISPEYSQGGFLITKYETEELILVGMRDNLTDRLLKPPEIIAFARQYGLKPYTIFQNTIEDLKALQNTVVGSTSEGWVVFFDYADGFLVKIKRLEYLHLFRAMKNVNPKTVLTMLLNIQFEEFLKSLPEELHLIVMEIYHTIQQNFERKYNELLRIFDSIPEAVKEDQKDYSLYIIQHCSQGLLKYLYKYKSTQKKEDLQQIFYRESL